MLLIVAAAAVSAAHFTPHSGGTAQATATVRIVRATRISLQGNGERNANDLPKPRRTTVTTEAGPTPARLIEFE